MIATPISGRGSPVSGPSPPSFRGAPAGSSGHFSLRARVIDLLDCSRCYSPTAPVRLRRLSLVFLPSGRAGVGGRGGRRVVFDESVFPFSTTTTPTSTPNLDLSSILNTDPVVEPPLSMFPAGPATPCPSSGSCSSPPAARDTTGPVPGPGLEGSPPGSATPPPTLPARFAQPVRVYQRRAHDAGPGPARFAQQVRVYQRRARLPSLPPSAPVAPSSSGSPLPPAGSSPPTTPTPPPRPPATRVATSVPPAASSPTPASCSPYCDVTRGWYPAAPGSCGDAGDSQVSPVPSSVREALLDPHWRRAMEEE